MASAWTVALALAVLLHARQTEWTARLDFLWQAQARDEKRDMDALQVRKIQFLNAWCSISEQSSSPNPSNINNRAPVEYQELLKKFCLSSLFKQNCKQAKQAF